MEDDTTNSNTDGDNLHGPVLSPLTIRMDALLNRTQCLLDDVWVMNEYAMRMSRQLYGTSE